MKRIGANSTEYIWRYINDIIIIIIIIIITITITVDIGQQCDVTNSGKRDVTRSTVHCDVREQGWICLDVCYCDIADAQTGQNC